jgi:hypothetical protein
MCLTAPDGRTPTLGHNLYIMPGADRMKPHYKQLVAATGYGNGGYYLTLDGSDRDLQAFLSAPDLHRWNGIDTEIAERGDTVVSVVVSRALLDRREIRNLVERVLNRFPAAKLFVIDEHGLTEDPTRATLQYS